MGRSSKQWAGAQSNGQKLKAMGRSAKQWAGAQSTSYGYGGRWYSFGTRVSVVLESSAAHHTPRSDSARVLSTSRSDPSSAPAC